MPERIVDVNADLAEEVSCGEVVPDDLPACAQARPGETLQLRVQSAAGTFASASAGSSTE